ncbi:hypothetical protein ES705_33208 [subsurface metagenome]
MGVISREREDLILCGRILLLEVLRLSPDTVRFQIAWLRKYVKSSLFQRSRDRSLILMLTWPIKAKVSIFSAKVHPIRRFLPEAPFFPRLSFLDSSARITKDRNGEEFSSVTEKRGGSLMEKRLTGKRGGGEAILKAMYFYPDLFTRG